MLTAFPDMTYQVDLALNNNDSNSCLLTCVVCQMFVVGNVTKVNMTIGGETPVSLFQFEEGRHEVKCTALNFNPSSTKMEMKLYLAGKVQKELRTTAAENDLDLSTAARANRYRLL